MALPSLCGSLRRSIKPTVLSQYHVSHRYEPWDGKLPYRGRQPGERSSVIFHDGRQADAELLGFDQTLDISLLQILQGGPYPHAPLTDPPALKLGDWVLKLGHPLGYQAHRPPVVRLGRVLYSHKDIFVTDCLLKCRPLNLVQWTGPCRRSQANGEMLC